MHSVRTLCRLRQLFKSPRIRSTATHDARIVRSQQRSAHSLVNLPYDIDGGLGDFLSPAALRTIAVEYQLGLLTRLTEQVKGTEMEKQSVVQTVISAASHREHALAFNYASQALNNSFFLHHLKPPPAAPATNEDSISLFMGDIRQNFNSIAQLKSTFSAAALGMINSGWVWLVCDQKGYMQVVATFGAGTLLVRSRRHMVADERKPILGEAYKPVYNPPVTPPSRGSSPSQRQREGPTITQSTRPVASPASGMQNSVSGLFPSTPYRTLHAISPKGQVNRPHAFSKDPLPSLSTTKHATDHFSDVGDILTPLLCVSVHEHMWMAGGYGIWGKEEYLKRFWTVVDWEAVSGAYYRATKYM